MAFPWKIARHAKLDGADVVEDMQLGLDLALAGHAPRYCEPARVTGRLPQDRRVALGQRTRWEHGHLHTLCTQVPRLLKRGLCELKLAPLALALELAVPPLSLLVMFLVMVLGMSLLAGLLGAGWTAAMVLGMGTAAVFLCLLAVWAKFGRFSLPLTSLLAAPFYVAWKLPMYLAFLRKPQKEWVRTSRASEGRGELARGILAQAAARRRELSALDLGGPIDMKPIPRLPYPRRVELGGVEVHAISEIDCIRHIFDGLEDRARRRHGAAQSRPPAALLAARRFRPTPGHRRPRRRRGNAPPLGQPLAGNPPAPTRRRVRPDLEPGRRRRTQRTLDLPFGRRCHGHR